MKVINISNFFAEFGGAFIEQLIILNEELIKQGNESILIFPEEARYTKWAKNLSEKYRVYFVSLINKKNKQKVINELKEIFKIENPDIIHSHFDGYDIPITKAAREDVIKIYHRHNEFDLSNLCLYKKIYASINLKVNMRYLRKKGYSIFNSKDMLKSFLNRNYVLENRALIVMNGISTKRLDKKYDISNNYTKPIILSFIGNWYRKGGDILFKAIEQINKENIKVYLASIVSQEFIIKNIGYLPKWFIPLEVTDDVGKYYSMVDIFVSSSRKETFSYALAEAIYSKLNCISSDIDGVQWAKEIPSVKFFKITNIEELVEKIEGTLIENYDEEVYDKSQKIIKEKYSEYVWVQNIINVYKDISGTSY